MSQYKTYKDEAGQWRTQGDLPIPELVKLAEKAIADSAGMGEVHFKFTCGNCGERCMFETPNMTFDDGECHECGHKTPFKEGGFLMVYRFNPPKTGEQIKEQLGEGASHGAASQ